MTPNGPLMTPNGTHNCSSKPRPLGAQCTRMRALHCHVHTLCAAGARSRRCPRGGAHQQPLCKPRRQSARGAVHRATRTLHKSPHAFSAQCTTQRRTEAAVSSVPHLVSVSRVLSVAGAAADGKLLRHGLLLVPCLRGARTTHGGARGDPLLPLRPAGAAEGVRHQVRRAGRGAAGACHHEQVARAKARAGGVVRCASKFQRTPNCLGRGAHSAAVY